MRVFTPENEWSPDEDMYDDFNATDEVPDWARLPVFWRPPREVDAATPGRDGVPYYDDDLDKDPDAAPRSYRAWREGETVVVSGPVGDWAKDNPEKVGFHGRGPWFRTRANARGTLEARHGAVLESYRIPNRYCYRFSKAGFAVLPAGEGDGR